MGASNKNAKTVRRMLNCSRKKNWVSAWRFVFSAYENSSGQERKFFIELSMLNPFLSPSEPVLGFTPRSKIQPEDLQNVLAGSVSAKKLESESIEVPSHVSVSVGMLGPGAKSLRTYTSIKNVKTCLKPLEVSLEDCFFSEDRLSGKIECSSASIQEHPEYFCDSGYATWDIQYEIRRDSAFGYKSKLFSWNPLGLRAVFAGTIIMDGKAFNVIPKRSFGYADCFFGKDFVYPWLHLSSSNFTSIISGKTLQNSSFALQGLFNDRFSAVLELEGKVIAFEAHKGKRAYECHWELNQINDNDEQKKLHWTITVHNRSYVIDIDVYSTASQMFVRTLELSGGARENLNVLSDGEGLGEIRLYKRIRRNLELIEYAKLAGTFCEFGQKEDSEF